MAGASRSRSGTEEPAGEPAGPGERVEVRLWESEPVDVWRDRWGLPALRVFKTVGSTNDVAREMAEAGAREGTTVVAETQTRGRGRRGREWASHDQQSISLSMVVRPRDQGSTSVLSIRLGLASARAMEATTGLAVGVKWPNDLLVNGRKVAGMLCEGVRRGDGPGFVVAGHGINVYQPDHLWTGELAGRATSLAAQSGAEIQRLPLLGAVVREWLSVLDRPSARLTTSELSELAGRDVLAGRAIRVDGRPVGEAAGVTPDGALRIRRQGGVDRIVSGTVRIQASAEENEA